MWICVNSDLIEMDPCFTSGLSAKQHQGASLTMKASSHLISVTMRIESSLKLSPRVSESSVSRKQWGQVIFAENFVRSDDPRAEWIVNGC
jgi:hypothetical protein